MFICQYCEREAKTKKSNVQHEIRCKENPDGVQVKPSYGMLGKKGKNQWIKAKELGTEYKLSEETRKKMSASSSGRKHSEETKKRLSKHRIEFLKENPDMVPYKLNHYSKGPSYPEIYWKGILDAHNVDYVEEYQISSYSLDFALVDKKIDLEIDGEQHYLDQRIVESDIRRTEFLENEGWTIIRIRWSEYQKLDRRKKEIFVRKIIKQLG